MHKGQEKYSHEAMIWLLSELRMEEGNSMGMLCSLSPSIDAGGMWLCYESGTLEYQLLLLKGEVQKAVDVSAASFYASSLTASQISTIPYDFQAFDYHGIIDQPNDNGTSTNNILPPLLSILEVDQKGQLWLQSKINPKQ
jgi:hypothetical protein